MPVMLPRTLSHSSGGSMLRVRLWVPRRSQISPAVSDRVGGKIRPTGCGTSSGRLSVCLRLRAPLIPPTRKRPGDGLPSPVNVPLSQPLPGWPTQRAKVYGQLKASPDGYVATALLLAWLLASTKLANAPQPSAIAPPAASQKATSG